jgi:hypothetical protein
MRRTGWATTFAADRYLLSMLDQFPVMNGRGLELGSYGSTIVYSNAKDERCLVAIGEAVDRFFDKCEDTVKHTSRYIRCWLRSSVSSFVTACSRGGTGPFHCEYQKIVAPCSLSGLPMAHLQPCCRLHRSNSAQRRR